MPISPVRSQTSDLQVQCNGLPLPTVRSAKYLGLQFDADMSWNTMVSHFARGVASKVGVLRRHATFSAFSMLHSPVSFFHFITLYLCRFCLLTISHGVSKSTAKWALQACCTHSLSGTSRDIHKQYSYTHEHPNINHIRQHAPSGFYLALSP